MPWPFTACIYVSQWPDSYLRLISRECSSQSSWETRLQQWGPTTRAEQIPVLSRCCHFARAPQKTVLKFLPGQTLIHSGRFCLHTTRKPCARLCLISKLFKELISIIRLHCKAVRCGRWGCRAAVLEKQLCLVEPLSCPFPQLWGRGGKRGRSATPPQLPKAPRASCSHANLGIRAKLSGGWYGSRSWATTSALWKPNSY